ncbi:Rhs family protein [Bacillus phage SP-15]|uniref:Rhs family protein n=1 Tax=Bacillus phage SP-15 TaxID=1792032 RepID=A0A127AYP2_9CAUD|nr:PAAR motif of membran proteins [Bacillus phage SP-15]AMM44851.1 Rhs family protein [Bacillus phage SP-15]
MSYDPNDIVLIDGKRGAVRWKDKCTGHDDFQPRGCVEVSPNVLINGRGANRLGDKWKMHYSVILLNEGDTPDPYNPGDTDYPPEGNGRVITDDDPEYPGPPLNVGDPGYPPDLPPDPGPPPPAPPEPTPPPEDATPAELEAYKKAMERYQKELADYQKGPLAEWQKEASKGPPYDGDTIYPSMKEYPDLGDSHDSVSASGSANVFVNGLPLCRVGDEIECGSRVKFGSRNVFVN